MAHKCLLISLFAGIVLLSSLDANAISLTVDLECLNPIEVILPVLDENCQKYSLCNNGKLVELSCGPKERFSPILKVRNNFS